MEKQELVSLIEAMLFANGKPLNIKTADIEKIAISLRYGCCCAKKPIILKELHDMIERFIKDNPNHNITPENCHILIGKKNNNTAMQDLKALIGIDGVKRNLEGIFELAKQEGFTGIGMPDDFSPFAPIADAIDLGLGINACLIGEKGTGKTEVAIDTIINQKTTGYYKTFVVLYVANERSCNIWRKSY